MSCPDSVPMKLGIQYLVDPISVDGSCGRKGIGKDPSSWFSLQERRLWSVSHRMLGSNI